MAKETGRKLIAQNKTARHDYFIEDVYECGLVLTGTEVKSLRAGRATLTDGFANSKDGELWLSGIHIPEYNEGSWTNHLPRRDRKLLLHKREIEKLTEILKQGQFSPLRVEQQIAILYLGTKNLLRQVPVSKVKEFEQAFLDRMERQHKSTLNELKAGQYTDAITAILEQCAKDLAGSYTA